MVISKKACNVEFVLWQLPVCIFSEGSVEQSALYATGLSKFICGMICNRRTILSWPHCWTSSLLRVPFDACYQPMTPWFDSDCAPTRRRTRALERRYRRTKLPDDRLAWTKQIRDLRRLYAAKQNSFWKAKIEDGHSNPKKNFGRHYQVYSAKINPERQSRQTVR